MATAAEILAEEGLAGEEAVPVADTAREILAQEGLASEPPEGGRPQFPPNAIPPELIPEMRSTEAADLREPERTPLFDPVTGNPLLQPRRSDAAVIAKRARLAGVSTDGAALGVRFSLGFGAQADRAMLEGLLSAYYGTEVPVRMGSATQRWEFLDPETGRPTLVNPPGADVGDLLDTVPREGMALTGELIGGGLGALVTRSPGGTVAGSTVGASAGELARLLVGQQLGVIDPDLGFDALLGMATTRAGVPTLAGGAGGVAVTRLGRRMATTQLRRLETMTPEQIVQLEQEIARTAPLEQRISERTGGEFRFSAAELASRRDLPFAPEFDDLERRVSRTLVAGGPLRENRRQQRLLLREAYHRTEASVPAEASTPTRVGREFRRETKQKLDLVEARLDELVEDAEATAQTDLERTVLRRARPADREVGETLREGVLAQQRRVAVEVEKEKYLELDEIVEQDLGVTRLDVTPLRIKAGVAKGITDSNIFKSMSQGDRQAIRDALKAGTRKVPPSPILTPSGKPARPGGVVDEGLTFGQLQASLSAVRRARRLARQGKTPDVNETVLRRLEEGLLASRQQALEGSPRLAAAVHDAELYVREMKDRFDRSVVADILEVRGGRQRMQDSEIFQRAIVRGSPEDAQILADILDHPLGTLSPDEQLDFARARDLIERAWLGMYEERVLGAVTTPKARRAAHERFFREFGEKIRPFFSAEDFERIRKLDGPQKLLEERVAQRERLMEVVRNRPEFRELGADRVAPATLFNRAWTRGDEAATDILIRETRRNPRLLERFRGAVHADMREFLVVREGGQQRLDFGKLNPYVNQHEPQLERLFGKEYVAALRDIGDAADIIGSRPPGSERVTRDVVDTPLMAGLRVGVGVLNRKARALTAFMRLREKTSEELVAEALARPEELVRLMKRRAGTDTRPERAMAILGASLGVHVAPLAGTDVEAQAQ